MQSSGTVTLSPFLVLPSNINETNNQTFFDEDFGSGFGGGGGGDDDMDSARNDFLRHSPGLTVVYCVGYFTVFVVGIFGNSFVVAVVHRSPRMKSVTNYFIVNLALADMIVIVCLPATLIGNIFNPWVLGWFACKTVPYLQGVSVSASINTLVAISIDRFLAICYPMKWQITTRVCRTIIVVIWIFSIVVTLPWAIYFTLMPMYADEVTPASIHQELNSYQVCQDIWPSELSKTVFFIVAHMTLCYLLPLSLISICYVLIWIRVWTRKLPGEINHGVDQMIHKSKIKVVKMLMAVVVLFALSWLPLYAIVSRINYGEPLEHDSLEGQIVYGAIPLAQWLGASNSCINPILYAFFNNKFRAGFKALLTGGKCCGTLHYDLTYKSSTFRSTSTCASKLSKTSMERRATLASYNNGTPV